MTHPFKKPKERKPAATGPTVKCPVCLGTRKIAFGDHTTHRCHKCKGTGVIVSNGK